MPPKTYSIYFTYPNANILFQAGGNDSTKEPVSKRTLCTSSRIETSLLGNSPVKISASAGLNTITPITRVLFLHVAN